MSPPPLGAVMTSAVAWIVGDGSNMMVYGWPVPLASTSDDDGDAAAASTQRTVLAALRQVLP